MAYSGIAIYCIFLPKSLTGWADCIKAEKADMDLLVKAKVMERTI